MRLRMGVLGIAAVAIAIVPALMSAQFPAVAQQAPATAPASTPQQAAPAKAAAPAQGAQAPLAAPDPNKVILDVVVAQKSGPAIAGLAQNEFNILDNGQPQPISSFKAVSTREPNTVSLVILDALNAPVERVQNARQELTKFLRSDGGKLSQPLQLAVLNEKGLALLGPPSIDGNVLATQVDSADTQLRTIRAAAGQHGAEERTSISISALSSLARGETGRPGRKLVVFLSPGWDLLEGPEVMLVEKIQRTIFQNVVQMNNDIRAAQMTIYVVDSLGLDASGGHAFYYKRFLKGLSKWTEAEYGNLGMQVMADQSGGLVLAESNDFAGELRRCLLDASNYYELTYTAPANGRSKPGQPVFHKVEVKLASQNDAARTLTGYYIGSVQ